MEVEEGDGGSGQTILLARRTRTIKLCSPGTRARLGALGVGRVRMLRAVKDNLATPLREDAERVEEEEGPHRGKEASWRVQGGRVRRSRSRARSPHPFSEF